MDQDKSPINETNKNTTNYTEMLDKNQGGELGPVSPNNHQKDIVDPEKGFGDSNSNIDKNTTEITDATTTGADARSIDDGSESQDEELKLRWDDDDDQVSMEYEVSNTVVDETEMALESNKTNPVDQNNSKTDEEIQVNDVLLGLKTINSGEESKIKTNITLQLTDKSTSNKCGSKNNGTDVTVSVSEQKVLGKIITTNSKDENPETTKNVLDNMNIPSIELLTDSPRASSCIKMDIDTCVDGDISSDKHQADESDNEEDADDNMHNKATLINSAQPDVGLIETSTGVNVDENRQTQKDKNNVKFGYDFTENEKNATISSSTSNNIENIKLSNIALTSISSKSVTNLDLGPSKSNETKDVQKYKALKGEVVDNLKYTSEKIISIQETSEDAAIAVKTDHGLNQPDFMLDIPTQELIDIDDVSINSEASDDIEREISLNYDEVNKTRGHNLDTQLDYTSRESNIDINTNEFEEHITEDLEKKSSRDSVKVSVFSDSKVVDQFEHDSPEVNQKGKYKIKSDLTSTNISYSEKISVTIKEHPGSYISTKKSSSEKYECPIIQSENMSKHSEPPKGIDFTLIPTADIEKNTMELDSHSSEIVKEHKPKGSQTQPIITNLQVPVIDSNIIKDIENNLKIDSNPSKQLEKEPIFTKIQPNQFTNEYANKEVQKIDLQVSTSKEATTKTSDISEDVTMQMIVENKSPGTMEIITSTSTKSLETTPLGSKSSMITEIDEMVYSKSDKILDVIDETKKEKNIVEARKIEVQSLYSSSVEDMKLTSVTTEEPLEVNSTKNTDLLTSTIDLKHTSEAVEASSNTANEISEVTNLLPINTINSKAIEINIQGSTCTEDAKLNQDTLSEVNKQTDNSDLLTDMNIYPSTSTEAVKVSSAMTEEFTAPKEIKNTKHQVTEIIVQPSAIESVKISQDKSNKATEVTKPTENITISTKIHILPSTSSKVVEITPSTSKDVRAVKQLAIEMDVQPSTSSNAAKMSPDTSDEVPEMTDSLGLLAESSRVMEDDEDPEDPEDDEDDDDFDPDDESSNQMTAEHSEDSNAHHSESDLPKDQEEKDGASPTVEGKEDRAFQFKIGNVVSETTEDAEVLDKDEDVLVDEIECEEMNLPAVAAVPESSEQVVDKIDVEKKDVPKQAEEPSKASDIETVKLSDVSDNEIDGDTSPKTADGSYLRALLSKPKGKSKQSPSKTKKLGIAQPRHVVNIVDLEESSSEEDLQDEQKNKSESKQETTQIQLDDVTSVNIPKEIEIMCTSGGSTSEIVTKKGEVVISGVPKPPPQKPARLNTSEVTIKTTSVSSESTLVIPETKISDPSHPKMGLEIFNLDSDEEEDVSMKEAPSLGNKLTALERETAQESNKCINFACKSGNGAQYYVADAATIAYYDAARKRKAMVCETCAEVVANRTQSLVDGIKDLTPLLDLDLIKISQELVEISDSDTESETETTEEPKETIGEEGAKLLDENLADLINETWRKYNIGSRLHEAHSLLDAEIDKLQIESNEIDAMLNECQVATDKLRNELYATFEPERKELPAVLIFDTPNYVYSCRENDVGQPTNEQEIMQPRQSKRRSSSSNVGAPAKRPAIPLGYTPLDPEPISNQDHTLQDEKQEPQGVYGSKLDDDKDVSVVNLSAEAAPADLPPPGDATRAPLRVGMPVFAMRNAFGSWLRGKVLECQPKGTTPASVNFTICRVKFEHKIKNPCKVLPARCLAYAEPPEVRLTIGTRVIALFKDSTNGAKRESYYSGIVAEIPNPVNNYRYLVFFDDGYAQYVSHTYTRLVCEYSSLVWEEVHPFSREFVRQYLLAYPERPMVRLHAGQSLKTEWNGKWWVSKVIKVDASLVQVHFEEDDRTEWIYRGSTRLAPLYLELQAAERHRARPLPRTKGQSRTNMPYVEYTRTDEQGNNKSAEPTQQQQEEIRRQRAVAKKSTAAPQYQPPPPHAHTNLDTVTSRVVYYTPKNAVRPLLLIPHVCSPKCKRSDVLALKDLRTYNPLAKPLLSGWERQIVRHKGYKEVMYRAPCGRRLRCMAELHRYLRAVRSDMPVDLFDFHPNTHCLAEFVLNKCIVGKKDLSHGKENVPVPCVNYYDNTLPEFCSYNTERTPTAGVPLNLDPDFLCGCDCTNDCEDKSKCACWQMTLEGARTIGLEGPNIGYEYKRLPEPLPSGIYECNSRCKCKQTCLNRVAQHPLQLKLQVFKTLNRGWGIRALNDIPKGSFLCIYAGNLLTDATANLDGLNEGDEYLAELDYIEVVEQMKEGYEEDIPDEDKKLDKKQSGKKDDSEEEESTTTSEDEEHESRDEKNDDDFRPGFIGLGVTQFNKHLRKRSKLKKEKGDALNEKDKEGQRAPNGEEDCITISDDEEVREPSRFTAQAGMGANEFISKYRSVRSHFGKDEACYIMDAKVQGNIGRYLNHSCTPNVFVQNVFVDTHDPRFPWVAFFALSHVRAGTELTWNYNYDVGSVPGKVLYCYCGAPNCRGRLL